MSPLSFIATAWQRFVFGKGVLLQADDGHSFLSKTNTLIDEDDNKDTKASPPGQKQVKLDASSTSFAKAAKQEGWGAPTATRPSLGGV
ncbi:hypothetical protein GSI_02869 [Ganoderma sinense ZZ0214-1]|uniref:Uncharacterized protein n=1 Tax=Ganoderma sinense ZZ0214-1 TaxID=1077348 RepID=A0A2G8SMU6_9APHY|nr:hypothetical protein GSI_02869 [Ganoderma sinense ZZ0214-1]